MMGPCLPLPHVPVLYMQRIQRTCLLLFIFLAGPALAACPPPGEQLQQAFFSLAPRQDAAVTQLDAGDLDDSSRLYFFSRVSGNTSGALLHRWRHNNHLLASVRLQSGAGSWQSWSAQPLGKDRSGQWEVEVLDDHLCLLGKLSLAIDHSDTVLAQVRDLLSRQDVTGAKLALKQALEQPDTTRAERQRWQAFMAHELVLAEVAADIRQQQLVAAEGRLQALGGNLDGPLEAQYRQLQQALQTAQQEADQTRLFRLLAAIHSLSISASCPTDRDAAQALLAPLLPGDGGVTRLEMASGQVRLDVTLPSGAARQLDWPCQPLLTFH